MKPAFRIVVDGEYHTSVIADRPISLLVTGEDGTKADRVEIELDNRDSRIAFPEIEARLEVSLGSAGSPLAPMGFMPSMGSRDAGRGGRCRSPLPRSTSRTISARRAPVSGSTAACRRSSRPSPARPG